MEFPRLTFLGQQSWMIDCGDGSILVDPVLESYFGTSPGTLRFDISPARTLEFDKMPTITAVALTNEHLDHMNLRSLNKLDRSVPVLVPEVMPAVCKQAVSSLGFEVIECKHGREVEIDTLTVTMLLGRYDVPLWESRVASLHVRSVKSAGVFVQSDTIPDTDALGDLCPHIFIATHNGQINQDGSSGAFQNLLPVDPEIPTDLIGVTLATDVLTRATDLFESVEYVLLSGGGYAATVGNAEPYLYSDYRMLADAANSLTVDAKVIALMPGESWTYGSVPRAVQEADWIYPSESEPETESVLRTAKLERSLFQANITDAGRGRIETMLCEMAPLLLTSALGRALIQETEYLNEPLGGFRFAVILRSFDDEGDACYVLNFSSARFERQELNERDAILTVPSGIITYAADLLATLDGKLHVWELAVANLSQWFIGDSLDSPVGFLYAFFSEQLQPKLATRIMANTLANGLDDSIV